MATIPLRFEFFRCCVSVLQSSTISIAVFCLQNLMCLHITRDICFLGRGTHITRDICFPGRETDITRDMCFPERETHITRDMPLRDLCFPGREHISGGVYVFLRYGNTYP